VRQNAGTDYGNWHPVGFGGDGLGNGQGLDAVVALGVRIAADAVETQRRSLI
jgi:small basic protein